jgi:hypothetical protein
MTALQLSSSPQTQAALKKERCIGEALTMVILLHVAYAAAAAADVIVGFHTASGCCIVYTTCQTSTIICALSLHVYFARAQSCSNAVQHHAV